MTQPLAIDLFCAYLITCAVTGHSYIGITSRGIRQRWNEHLYSARKRPNVGLVNRAISKHGAAQFSIRVICEARSWANLCAIESVLIEQFQTRAPHGYNLSDGGEGPFGVKRSAESVERSAAKHRGKPCHPNTVAAARARKGQKKPPGHGAKVAAALRGTHRTEETKAKLSVYWAKRRAEGAFKTAEPYAHFKKVSVV